MNIESITVDGFKSFESKQTFDFSTVNGLIYIHGLNNENKALGANGVGKSALFADALTWVLFGKTPNNIRASNIKNWKSQHCRVVLNFDGKVLERTWNPNQLLLDGRNITQQELENLLNLNFDIFISSVVLSQFGEKFIDLTPALRLELITNILLDERWDEYSNIAKTLFTKTEQQIQTLLSRKLTLSTTITNYFDTIKKLEEDAKQQTRENENREAKIENLKTTLSSLQEPKKPADVDILDTLLSQKENLKSNFIKNQTLIKTINEQINNLSTIDSICPTCKQPVNDDYKKDIIKNLLFQIEIIGKENHSLHKKINLINTKIDNIQNKLKVYESKKQEVAQQKKILESEIKILQSIKKQNYFNDMIAEYKNKIIELDTEVKNINNNLIEKTKQKDVYSFWVKGFKEIKLMLLLSFLKQLEVLSNKNLSDLGLGLWKIKCDIESETKNRRGLFIKILNPIVNDYIPYECCSGGELQRIRIAISFALAELLRITKKVRCDIMVLDEPTQHMSEEGIDDLLSFLKDKSKYFKIFYIDHRDIKNLGIFNHIVTIIKDSNGTRINM